MPPIYTQTHASDIFGEITMTRPTPAENLPEAMTASHNATPAQALATQLGYDGALTVGALEDEIRFYQHRTAEVCLELGKRLIMLKELTPHGDFAKRAELLGFSRRMAQKFMSATLKFSKANSNSLLRSAGTQTKLLELVLLDEDEIEELENGGSVRGIDLDDVEAMSVSELKKALRDGRDKAKQDLDAASAKHQATVDTLALEAQAKDKRISTLESIKTSLNEELITKNEALLLQQQQPELVEKQLIANLQATGLEIYSETGSQLVSDIVTLFNHFSGSPPEHIRLIANQQLGMLITQCYDIAADLGLEPQLDADKAADDPAKQDAEDFAAYDMPDYAGWLPADTDTHPSPTVLNLHGRQTNPSLTDADWVDDLAE